MMKIIEIVVDAKGEATVQTKGFAGSSCREASRLLEQALGEAVEEKCTSEFYQNAEALNRARNQAGS
jgi:Protein of unknown function (DUF2997)